MADKKIKVTLVKSTIGAIPKHKATVAALGLKKTGRYVYQRIRDLHYALRRRSARCPPPRR